jgi:hypothetical protein
MLLELKKARCYTASTAVRYYAEWLDGEYVLLNQVIHGYDHSAVMERAIRFHALFGSTVVLSDVQMIDFRTPIPTLFLDRDFRAFLNEKHNEKQNFLALVADPVRGAKNEKFAIAMKGIERLTDQANKPADSYEMAVTQLGGPIFRAGSFNAERYLNPRHAGKGHVGRVIKRFPQYRDKLRGLLHAVDYFSGSPLSATTMPSTGSPERYDTLLQNAQNDHEVVDEARAKRIEKILRIQEKLPDAQQGRRAAIRKMLGTGQWHHEDWTPENLRLYLDVVHAWNCAINRSIAPEAGTLYESSADIPLSRYERSVTDKVGWFRAGPMPSTDLSARIRRFLSWDPLNADWKQIAAIVRGTQKSAEVLQASLKTGNTEDRAEALTEHASEIADRVIGVRTIDIPEWVWWISKAAVAWASDAVPPELVVDAAQDLTRSAPYASASIQRPLVVNTLKRAGSELLVV